MKGEKNIKLCIVCSGGGHLTECLQISESLPYDRYFVTFPSQHQEKTLKNERYYNVINPYRNLFRFMVNFIQSLNVFMKEWPDFILSNGASVAVSTIVVAKLFKRKVIFVTPAAAVFTPCVTGRRVYRICDLFIVSWKPLLKYYKNAVYVGDFIK